MRRKTFLFIQVYTSGVGPGPERSTSPWSVHAAAPWPFSPSHWSSLRGAWERMHLGDRGQRLALREGRRVVWMLPEVAKGFWVLPALQSQPVLGLSVKQCLCFVPERVFPEAFSPLEGPSVLLKGIQPKVLAGRGASTLGGGYSSLGEFSQSPGHSGACPHDVALPRNMGTQSLKLPLSPAWPVQPIPPDVVARGPLPAWEGRYHRPDLAPDPWGQGWSWPFWRVGSDLVEHRPKKVQSRVSY